MFAATSSLLSCLLLYISIIIDPLTADGITYDFDCLDGCRRLKRQITPPPSWEIDDFNDTIPENYTENFDNHIYYNQTTLTSMSEADFNNYYKDVKKMIENKEGSGSTEHPQLAASYRRAVATRINFSFPFYDFPTQNVTIATGGFLYVGEHTHSWLAATQYIAPLMANFDTSGKDDATISFVDTGKMFVVEWKQVQLRKQEEAGNFTFECVLWQNGSIWFLYKNMPIAVSDIKDDHHPHKMGLSDAYMDTERSNRSLFTKRVIYEYHRIEINKTQVKNYTIIMLDPAITCFSHNTCDSCMSSDLAAFNCTWCSMQTTTTSTQKVQPVCSDTNGRHRWHEQFKNSQCSKQNADSVYCNEQASTTPSTGPDAKTESSTPAQSQSTPNGTGTGDKAAEGTNALTGDDKPAVRGGHSGVVFVCILLVLALCTAGWLGYAYLNPHTTSGQLLIRYRPTRWSFSNRDVRYTASVHM